MKIIGNRVLVSKIVDDVKDGFQAVQVQDSFVNKGKIEIKGNNFTENYKEGDIILFAKYSPDTQEIDHEGKKMKIINADDIIAVL